MLEAFFILFSGSLGALLLISSQVPLVESDLQLGGMAMKICLFSVFIKCANILSMEPIIATFN